MNDNIILTPPVENPSPIIDIDSMSDENIKQLIAQSYKLLDKRKREYERNIKEQIRKMAVEAGIKVSFSNKTTRKAPATKSG